MRVPLQLSGEKINDEQLAALQKHVHEHLERYPEDYEYSYSRGHLKGTTFLADPVAVGRDPALKGLRFTIMPGEMTVPLFTQLVDTLRELESRMCRFEVKLHDDGAVSSPQINNRVDVHVPNLGLLKVDEVELLEDGCTNALQLRLDEGWRILSICPQPNQRRPDYILGRTKS
jgi:hypothetical protein